MNKLDDALNFHQSALRVRGQRQELIAANIANADTPNFKARDVDFGTAMKNALAGNASKAFNTTTTSAGHMNGTPSITGGPGEPLFRPVIQGSVDGNTVDMDVERNRFAENAVHYDANLTFLNSQIKLMLAALQG